MGIRDAIVAMCTQTAVYWGNPANDGSGGKTFDVAVEISCRWEAKREKITNVDGEEIISSSLVFTTQDVDEEGYLYLGELDDLSSNPDDPKDEDGAFEIKRFDKSPALRSTTDFVRKAYL